MSSCIRNTFIQGVEDIARMSPTARSIYRQKRAAEMHEAGASNQTIAEELRLSAYWVGVLLRRAGVPSRKRAA